MRRNVLITGGAGFIGSHLAQPGAGVMSGARGYSKSVHALEPAGAA